MKYLPQFTFALIALISCKTSKHRSEAQSTTSQTNPAWIEKVSRAIRNDERINIKEMQNLKNKSEDEVLDYLMTTSSFYWEVLDFNHYFLGAKQDAMFEKNDQVQKLKDYAYYYPSALASAYNLSKNKDYLALFDYLPTLTSEKRDGKKFHIDFFKYYIDFDFDNPKYFIDLPAEKITLENESEVIEKTKQAIQRDRDRFLTDIQQIGFEQACLEHPTKNYIFYSLPSINESLGLSRPLRDILNDFIKIPCSNSIAEDIRINAFKKSIDEYLEIFTAFTNIPNTLDFNDKGYPPFSILEQSSLQVSNQPNVSAFTQLGFWRKLPNSSTNFNRKRAAYILNTFFCDDLTPINVATPPSHGSNLHASLPACQACHYKLDPMAGFFKKHGQNGIDFVNISPYEKAEISKNQNLSGQKIFVFDDLASRTDERVDEYFDEWKNKENTNRIWKIGYIRSTMNESQNSYGEKLSDLFSIIKTAPEAKQCLVKKMVDYYIGKSKSQNQVQIYDGEWLDMLTKTFSAHNNSSEGFKQTLKLIVKSKTFRQENANPSICYDTLSTDANKPPCGVAFNLKKNCGTCHSGTSGAGGLSLTHWIQKPDGKFGFAHIKSNQEVNRCQTYSVMRERLNETDRNKKMPLFQDMPELDKASLYKWLDQMIIECQN